MHAQRRYGWLDPAELHAAWQDVIVVALRTYRPGPAGLGVWVRTLWRRSVSDVARRAKTSPTTFGEVLDDTVEAAAAVAGFQTERGVWAEEAMAAVLQLPPRRQSILVAWLHGQTYAEVAETMGISRARAHREVVRSLEIIRERFDDDAE